MKNVVRSLLLLIVVFWACKTESDEFSQLPEALDLHWRFDMVDALAGTSEGVFVLANTGSTPLSGNDWALFFNQLYPPSAIVDTTQPFMVETITGEYHAIRPKAEFTILEPGDSLVIPIAYNGFAGRSSYVPKGAYIANGHGNTVSLSTSWSFPANHREPVLSTIGAEAAKRYDINNTAYESPREKFGIVPRPRSVEVANRQLIMRSRIAIACPSEFVAEANMLADMLKHTFTGSIEVIENVTGGHIVFYRGTMPHPEGYSINTDNGVIEVTAATGSGALYAGHTIMRMIDLKSYQEPSDQLVVQGVNIDDSPRFPYRGLHLDVSRNFHSVAEVKRIIDQMAFYKLNKLLITLTNDEGWRVEIRDLPELTTVGARRGHTVDESDRLYPAYGSGADVTEGQFYARDEFMELLQYAKERHIDIIPEVDVPGHSRAAIKAMAARAKSLSGGSSGEYILHDPNDVSEYVSAQNYNDNVICVCRESTYDFIDKVIAEIVQMYSEAGANLEIIHSGGDEIPTGAWKGSPLCAKWISDREELDSTDDLQAYFFKRFIEILSQHEVRAGGWEEIVLTSDEAGHNTTNINYDFVDQPVQPYVWNSVWGWGREDMAYKLANAGYEIVMCNSGSLYFDLAYESHPEEPGLTWSGYVDERSAFEFAPYNMFAVATEDRNGEPLDVAYVSGKVRLNEDAKMNIKGIQGQLWSETIDDSGMLDYYLFPKLLGLAERAWSGEPDWTKGTSKPERMRALNEDWVAFATAVGWHELPRLGHLFGGTDYRIPIPGARIDGETLRVNARYPNLTIRFTEDGSVPDQNSAVISHTARIKPGSHVVVRAFALDGRGGIAVDVGAED